MKPFEYVVDLVLSIVPVPQLPPAMRALMPILSGLLTTEQVLSDDVRASLQTQVLRALKRAGLEGVELR
jgi:hypothetical protein